MRSLQRYPAKPIDRPDHISVLVPTRGRPQGMHTLLQNFQQTVARKDLFDVWIFVDNDDRPTLDYIDAGHWRPFGYPIHWHVAPARNSMGEMFSELWQSCTSNAGIYFPFADDYVVTTDRWDEVLRRFNQDKDGFLLGYLSDPTAQPHQVTIAIPSARWLNTIGYFVSERFYFWFGDAWLDEVAQMADCKALIPIQVQASQGKGKTARMRNLPFWCRYFVSTLEERYREACLLLEAMHRAGPELEAARERAKRIAAILMHKSYGMQTAQLRQDEARFRDFSKLPSPGQVAGYLASEAQAVEELLALVRRASDRADSTGLLELLETLALSSFTVPDLDYLKAETLHRLGFRNEALACIAREMELRPDEPKGGALWAEIHAGSGPQDAGQSERSALGMPSWIDLEDRQFLYFPEQVDPELYFTMQAILYQDPGVDSVLDVGAGAGAGSSRAILEAAEHLPHLHVYCIEPDVERFAALSRRYGGRARLFNAASVAPQGYATEKELDLFYRFVPSIMNALPLEEFQSARAREIAYQQEHRLPVASIERIKREHGIENFGLVLLDGSQFCGDADLREVYGARYLALSYVKGMKNYANFQRLSQDGNYRLIAANLNSGCGYAVFARTARE